MSTNPVVDFSKMAKQVLVARGPMTIPNLVQVINEELLPRPIRATDLLFQLRRLVDKGYIPSALILPTKLPSALSPKEAKAIRLVVEETRASGYRLTILELAEQVLKHTMCGTNVQEMAMKIRFVLIPLHSDTEDLHDEEED